jgi:DNA-directed RNA polymerase subunit N (RpoN/RPB10)
VNPVACHVCGGLITDPFHAYEKRVEYRGIRKQDRFRTRKVGDICRACVLAEIGEVPKPKQETLS